MATRTILNQCRPFSTFVSLKDFKCITPENQDVFFEVMDSMIVSDQYESYCQTDALVQWFFHGKMLTLPPPPSKPILTCPATVLSLSLVLSLTNLRRLQRLLEFVEFPKLKVYRVQLETSKAIPVEDEKEPLVDPVTRHALLCIPLPVSNVLKHVLVDTDRKYFRPIYLIPLVRCPSQLSSFSCRVYLHGMTTLSMDNWKAAWMNSCVLLGVETMRCLVWLATRQNTRSLFYSKIFGWEVHVSSFDQWQSVLPDVVQDPDLSLVQQLCPLVLIQEIADPAASFSPLCIQFFKSMKSTSELCSFLTQQHPQTLRMTLSNMSVFCV